MGYVGTVLSSDFSVDLKLFYDKTFLKSLRRKLERI